jgi:surface antigen
VTKKFAAVALVAALGLGVAGCAEQNAGPKESVGTLLGAGLGGLAGAQIGSGTGQLAAVAGGALLGAFLGNQVGSSLDKADAMYADQTAQETFEYERTGTTRTWTNPDSGNSGTITPTRTYEASSGEYCREYQQTVTVGGQTQDAYGTACRQPDGSWKVVN